MPERSDESLGRHHVDRKVAIIPMRPSFDGMPTESRMLSKWLLSESRLDILRNGTTLSELVAAKMELERTEDGEFRGNCPAEDHDDQDRSFFVNDRICVFHCFGCGIHGDVVRWMTDHQGIDYVEAVRRLIRRAAPV